MTRFNSRDLTLKDLEAIDNIGAEKAAKQYDISLTLAKRCEDILRNKIQKGGAKKQAGGNNKKEKGYRKIKKSEASTESDMMKQMLDSSSEDNNQRPAQHMQMNYSQPIVNNQYDKTYNLQNMQVPNYNPQTNATMPNLTNDGSMPIQPITGQNVMQQMVNNPNPNMFNMDNANQSNGLPPKPDKVDPLMMNHIAPVVTQDKVLSYLKQLNAI
jgi:hypothetical protein